MPDLSPALDVAVVTQGYSRGGGVQSVARWLVRGLRELGHRVDVHELGGHHGGEADSPAPCAVEPGVTHWRPRAHASEPLRYLPVPALTARLDAYNVVQVVAGGPALTLVTGATTTPVALQVATRLPWERARLRHGSLHQRALWIQAQFVAGLEPAAVRRAGAVLVENDTMLEECLRLGATHVVKAPPGVDTTRFRPRSEGLAVDGYFLSVCRLWDPRKGLDRMVDAYAAVVETGDPRPLVLAGRGRLHPAAAARLDHHRLRDRVQLRPDVPLNDLPGLYQGASQFWQTSHEEGLGISVLEAMASGLPVIATETAGSSECVDDGTTGTLVGQEGVDVVRAWPQAVRLATRHADEQGGAGRARAVAEFSDAATLARYDRVYHRLVAAGEEQHE